MSEDEVKKLRFQLDALKNENVVLKKRVDELVGGFASKVEPGTLIRSVQSDLLRVDEFAMRQERPTTYVVSDFNIQLKAVVTMQADKPVFVLPSRPGEIDPGVMSSVNISLKPVPLAVLPVTRPRPVESVEGIGPILADKLRGIGIHTVTDLALASSPDVTKANISDRKAAEFIGMAKLMVKGDLSGVEGVDEQSAELLVVAGKIDSKEKLAESNPEELYEKLRRAIETRAVRVPKGYKLTIEDVKRWTDSAKAIMARFRIP